MPNSQSNHSSKANRADRKNGLRTVIIGLALLILIAPVRHSMAAPENRPYDASLMRLSEILGAVHYLRALCGINDQQTWRLKMQELITAEGVTVKRKIRLTKNFNKGYKSFQRTYRLCTPSAKVAIDHFLEEGIEIVDKLVANHR